MSMAIVVISWETYRTLALNHQRAALSELVSYESDEIFEHLEESLRDIGYAAQSEPSFRAALTVGDHATVVEKLKSQFRQYFVTAGVIDLVQLSVYDLDLNLVAQVTDEADTSLNPKFACERLLQRSEQRSGADRLVALSETCVDRSRALFSVLLPVGGLRPVGYIQLIADPVHNLKQIQSVLSLSLKIKNIEQKQIFLSDNWPILASDDNSLLADVALQTTDGQIALHLLALRDITEFISELNYTRNVAAAVAGVLTLITVFLALWIIQSTTLQPLQILTRQLQRVRQDRSRLGEPIDVGGNTEISELAKVFNDMSGELARLYNKYKQMAFSDSLTLLPNRELFHRRMTSLLKDSRERKLNFAVLLLDLDGFKEVNDTLGHHVGDALLQQVSDRLRQTIATITHPGWGDNPTARAIEGTMVARLGGDEFAIVCPGVGDTRTIERVINFTAARLMPHFDIEGQVVGIGGTFGVSVFPAHGLDGDTLLRRADVALYAAKRAQQRFAFYDASLDQHSLTQLTLKTELGHAIDSGQLVLVYQPKLNLRNGKVHGVEALVRWRHPERGLILPDQFISLAEQRGLMHNLTHWVIDEALRQHCAWSDKSVKLKVAINLSTSVLYDLELPDKIGKRLAYWSVPPTALELEITEEATMRDPGRALDILSRLSAMGISLAIDDFGTGYSSLGYLKRLPVNKIKIDKSFVIEMLASDSDAKIVHATIDLAHNLGLRVVAEGVESEAHLRKLSRMNCDIAQGVGISAPLLSDDLLDWLAEGYTSKWPAAIAPTIVPANA